MKVKKVRKSEKKWKGGRFKESEAKFKKLPSNRGQPKFMIHKIAHPPLPPKIRFFPQIAPYHPRFSKRINNQLLKNTLIICRVWRNAISSEMFYISSKMNEISSNKFEIFSEMFEFLSKMLKISIKVFKNWCEYSIIKRKNTDIYPKNILKTLLLSALKFEKVADNKARFECNDI